MTPLSLRWRASLLVSVVLVAAITTISTVAYIEFEESHFHEIDLTLVAVADDILASLNDRESEEKLTEDVRTAVATFGQDDSTFYRIWIDDSSTDILVSDLPDGEHRRWLRELSDRACPLPGQSLSMNIGRRGNEHRAIWLRREVEDGIVNVVLASSSRSIWRELREFQILLPILGVSLVMTSAVAVVLSIRWGLRPIGVTAERLHLITHPNVGNALFDGLKVPGELRPFAAALTEMLSRLDKVLQQQKQFTSDADSGTRVCIRLPLA
ncbi:MAG: hypothetical protein ISS70_02850 [Phycisphaerae bacterium]|nr:hypothetical protein [Phycisphaerae bacterium]